MSNINDAAVLQEWLMLFIATKNLVMMQLFYKND